MRLNSLSLQKKFSIRCRGRVHVGTDDIVEIGGEVGIGGSLEGPDPVRLEL
jgi:hypothetical protein